MERLQERQDRIVTDFTHRYEGHMSHGVSAWSELRGSISIYNESCETFIERMQRKKALPKGTSLSSLMLNLYERLEQVINEYGFPVSQCYQKETRSWLANEFQGKVGKELLIEDSSEDPNDLDHTPYEYKTYWLDYDKSITCLEETVKMGNHDGTTGLITWQGAIGLFNFVTTSANAMPKETKILELGSGSGLFGLSLLKSGLQEIKSYTFSDVHFDVLNAIVTNYHINFAESQHSRKDLKNWMQKGHLKIMGQDKCRQYSNDEGTVQVHHLDWLDCSDEQIGNLDYNVIFGSDLTYVLEMLHPLAILLKRLLVSKKDTKAYIACTHRTVNTVDTFLQNIIKAGLNYSLASRMTFGPADACVITHEPLHTVSVFEICVMAS